MLCTNASPTLRFLACTLGMVAGLCACSGPSDPTPEPTTHSAAGWWVDGTLPAGLEFTHESGGDGGLHLPEIMAAGAALFDSDGDGDLDLYLTNGNRSLNGGVDADPPRNRLFVQRDDGTFDDATGSSGLGDTGYGMGVAIGDVDNDGDLDVYVTNYGPDRLYRNRGDGTFADVSRDAGIDVPGFSCSAVFCDYDGDGYLDLYVTQYVRYDPRQVCSNSSGQRDYCSPRAFTPAPDVLLRNDGDGTFTDVSTRAGISRVAAAGLGVVCEDLNEDGRPDFYAANDQYANHLWLNRGDGTFEDGALLRGVAYNLEGRTEAGMGIVGADLDGDLDLDLFVTHLSRESNTFYRHLGAGVFEDATGGSGLAQSSLPFTGFGTAAFDVEADGDLDLLVANGRVFRGEPEPAAVVGGTWSFFAEPNLFYLGRGDGHFAHRADLAGPFGVPREISRAIVAGDVDSDGDVDVVVASVQSGVRLYLNEAPRLGDWLIVRAIDPELRRDAIGAKLTAIGPSRRFVRTVSTGFGYLSSHDPRVHFGLGRDHGAFEIEVRWPDGERERFRLTQVNRFVTVTRGSGEATR